MGSLELWQKGDAAERDLQPQTLPASLLSQEVPAAENTPRLPQSRTESGLTKFPGFSVFSSWSRARSLRTGVRYTEEAINRMQGVYGVLNEQEVAAFNSKRSRYIFAYYIFPMSANWVSEYLT